MNNSCLLLFNPKTMLKWRDVIMVGKSRKRQEIHHQDHYLDLPTHNALIPGTGTVAMVVYFKQHVPLGRLLRIQLKNIAFV